MKDKRKIVDTDTYMPVFRELLMQGKKVFLTITGNSMSPFLIHGRDQILIAPPEGNWKKGDMAFFVRDNGKYVMHRICRVDKEGNCYFVGDAQVQVEGPIAPEQIFGKIISVQRKGKWIGPEDFWWRFFERIWIRMIPLRPLVRTVYGMVWRIKAFCGII